MGTSKNEKKYKTETSTPKSSPVKEVKKASASKSETERIRQDQENYKNSKIRKIAHVYMIIFNLLCLVIGFAFLVGGIIALHPEVFRGKVHDLIDQQKFSDQNNIENQPTYDPNYNNSSTFNNDTYYNENDSYETQTPSENPNSSDMKKAELKQWVDKVIDIIQDHLGAAPLILVFISILSFVVGIVGCGMTCCNNLKFLRLYLFVSSLVLVFFFFGVYILARKYVDFLKITVAGMTFLMQMYGKNQMSRQIVDLVQQQGHCCGALELTDWQTFVAIPGHFDFSYNNSITVGDYPVPGSCCQDLQVCNFTQAAQNSWNGRQDGMSDIRDMQLHDGDILNEWRQQFAEFFRNKTEHLRKNIKREFEYGLQKLKKRGQEVLIQKLESNRQIDLNQIDLAMDTNIQVDLSSERFYANGDSLELADYAVHPLVAPSTETLPIYEVGYPDDYYAAYGSNSYNNMDSAMEKISERVNRARRETDSNNDSSDEEDTDAASQDYMADYSYENFPEEHRIFGVGCNTKFIRRAEKQKIRFIGMMVLVISPFLLAYLAALIDSKRIRTEHAAKDLESDK